MKLKLCITNKSKYLGTRYIRADFGEDELLEWAKKYMEENYHDEGSETTNVEIESMIP